MPQSIREALAAKDYPDVRSMAAAADLIWDLRQTAPPTVTEEGPTRGLSRSPYNGGHTNCRDNHRQSPSNRHRDRAQTPAPHLRKLTKESVGTMKDSTTNLTNVFPPVTGREIAHPPDGSNTASGGDCQNENGNSNVLLTRLRTVIFERQVQQTVLSRRFWSHLEHIALLFRGGAACHTAHWGKQRQHPHLGVSKIYLGIWRQNFHTRPSSCQSGNPYFRLSSGVPAVHPPPASIGIGQRPKTHHIAVCSYPRDTYTTGKHDTSP
jgi:hypothetical protein